MDDCRERGKEQAMAVLELVSSRPDWLGALTVALTRPPGIAERRSGQDPWEPGAARPERPRRISDDLAWLRQAFDEPEEHGLKHLDDTAAVMAWETDAEAQERLKRLRDRNVLEAAGFLLHEEERITA
jgi:hypothetical protein